MSEVILKLLIPSFQHLNISHNLGKQIWLDPTIQYFRQTLRHGIDQKISWLCFCLKKKGNSHSLGTNVSVIASLVFRHGKSYCQILNITSTSNEKGQKNLMNSCACLHLKL